jgi:hypothetical protein
LKGKDVLNLDEIKKLKTINAEIVREALNQAEKRLTDLLDLKKQVEERANNLLKFFSTLTIAGVSAASYLQAKNHEAFIFFGVFASFSAVSMILLSFTFRGSVYGTMGSTPSMWLESKVLRGNKKTLTKMLAYITYYYQNRIDKSKRSNETKIRLVDWSENIAIAGFVIALLVWWIL